MRTTLNFIIAAVLALTCLSASALAGGGNRVGSDGGDQVLVPVGARGIALGSSFSAGITGLNALYYNPAGVSASSQRAEAMFSYMNSIGGVGVSYFAVGTNFSGFGNLAFSVKSLSFGDIAVTDERNPDGTGGTFAPAFVTIGLTYSRALTDRIRAGVTAYLISETIDRTSASTVAMDIGVQYNGLAGVKGLQMGVTLRHLGASMKYDGPGLYHDAKETSYLRDAQLLKVEAATANLPTSLELGLAYTANPAPDHMVTLAGSFENNNYLDDQYRIGLEYSFMNTFFLRGSWTMAPAAATDPYDSNQSSYEFGPAFGAGIHYNTGEMALSIDYAYRSTQLFTGNHVVTIGIGF